MATTETKEYVRNELDAEFENLGHGQLLCSQHLSLRGTVCLCDEGQGLQPEHQCGALHEDPGLRSELRQ